MRRHSELAPRHIMVVGVSGIGKSAISRRLSALGQEAYDIESLPGLFAWFRRDTGERFHDIEIGNRESIKQARWLCDAAGLSALLARQSRPTAFYCGNASNNDELVQLFDTLLLLRVSPEELRRRLAERAHTGEYGNSAEMRDQILSWQDWYDKTMIGLGAIPVDASGTLEETVDAILRGWGAEGRQG